MAAVGILAPDPLWSALRQTGIPAANGYVFTYQNGTRIPQATYLDPGLANPQTNPIRLNTAGEAVIYWVVDDESPLPLYTILIYAASDVDGVPGQLIFSTDNYPSVGGGGGGDITIINGVTNYARNEQFTWWTHGTTFSTTDLIAGDTPIADDWYFRRANTDAAITISKVDFNPQTNPPPGTAVSYLEYNCTTAATDSVNVIFQNYGSVQSLANTQVTVGFWAKTRDVAATSTVSIWVQQYFGTGGTPTPAATLYSHSINDEWTFYSTTFTVPSIAATTIGPGSQLRIGFQFQINQVIASDVTDIQFQPGLGTGDTEFPYRTTNDQYSNIFPGIMAGYSDEEGTNEIGWAEDVTLKEFLVNSKKNLLICNDFRTNPNQFGAVVNSTSVVLNNDATYIADGCILQSDGNNIVSKNSFIGGPLVLTVVAANTKFGCAQIVEQLNVLDSNNQSVSGIVSLKVSAGTPNLKIAIVGWSGTADQPTQKIVQAWNAAGTNPSLATNWNYLGNITTVAVSTAQTDYPINDIPLTTNPNIALIWWIDSDDMGAAATVSLYYWGINAGKVGLVPPLLSINASLAQARRYRRRTYAVSETAAFGAITPTYSEAIPLVSGEGNGAFLFPFSRANPVASPPISLELDTSLTQFGVYFNEQMFAIPAVTFYNPNTGGAGTAHILYTTTNLTYVSGTPDVSITLSNSNINSMYISLDNGRINYTIPGLTTGTVNQQPMGTYHYIANATIGV